MVALATGLWTGCDGARYPGCKTNDDCVDRSVNGALGPVCSNLRCVECGYDSDCDAGTCNASHECERLATASRSREADKPEPKDKTHASWDECAAECKDESCIKACEEKFGGPRP